MRKVVVEYSVVKQICEFPRLYRSGKNVPAIQLYEESAYENLHTQISQSDFEAVLKRNPAIIDSWVSFSEDKRWSPAWGLEKLDEENWNVFLFDKDGRTTYQIAYTSGVSACALMIRMEMEDFRLRKKQRTKLRR